MSKSYYLTTPLFYCNGMPHVGHVCTAAVADAIARYRRMTGHDVWELTGSDEHGQKIERAARQRGVPPQQLTDRCSKEFKTAWKSCGIEYDEFLRTTDPRHKPAVEELFQRLKSKGYIYQAEINNAYCVGCEVFVGPGQATCPDCGQATELVAESSYFFKLSQLQEKLVAFYQDNPDFVVPKPRMVEIANSVKSGLTDFSISRTSFSWGIPVPGDEKHVFYVWFDALAGYLSGAGFPQDMERFTRLWPADVQVTGSDGLRFHAIHWPAMLMAAGLEPPRHILAHGWWTIEGRKVSKGKGTPVTAQELAAVLPRDCVKYFLIREMPQAADVDFSYDSLAAKVNGELANELGNLTSRVLKMIENYFQGLIPEPGEAEGGDEGVRRFSRETVQLYREHFDKLAVNKALDSVWELTRVVNKYLLANEPWLIARDLSKRPRLASVLYTAAEGLRVIATMLRPFAPDGASAIIESLGFQPPADDQSHRVNLMNWGELKPGARIGASESPFQRLDTGDLLKRVAAERSKGEQKAAEQASPASAASTGEIAIEDFAKIEMRVGKIIAAERVPKSDKLVKLQVDVGADAPRQVVAGIGKAYAPEDLPGRLVVVLVNLKPAKLMGVASNGMIIAASDQGVPVLATFTEPVVVGSRLK